ncbi:MAG: hypothetical protein MUD14_26300 [Hydrococcus sp. Prado102]|jgi:hypothetical protein|nr:hypothetical protein [Hydrococcus sp. Prado102]
MKRKFAIWTTTILAISINLFPFPVQATKSDRETLTSQVIERDREIQSNWYLFTSMAGKLQVEMPGIPTQFSEEQSLNDRTFQWNLAEVLIPTQTQSQLKRGAYYLVGYTDLAEDYLRATGKDEVFDAQAKYIFEEIFRQGETPKFREQKKVTKDDIEGKVYIGEAFDKNLILVFYLVDRRLYLNFSITDNQADLERFFSSFYVLEN